LPQTSLGEGGPGAGGFWGQHREDAQASATHEVGEGLLTHYTDRLAGSLTRGLTSTKLSLAPLPIFGETDTQARLTATQRLGARADLIYSVNPRDAEGQTHILDLHDFDFAPGVGAQVFTNDDNDEGATLVQIVELGGGKRAREGTEWLGKLVIEAPEGISRRGIERSLDLRKGDLLAEDAAFDAEVDALEELRRQGYPGAWVTASTEPLERRTKLGLVVDPGPRVSFEFEGEKLPRTALRGIEQSYRTADEKASLEEMRAASVAALRQEGFLDPTVEVTVTAVDGDEPAPGRLVRVWSEGGQQADPGAPELVGVGAAAAAIVADQFESRLARIELAVGLPGADRYLVQSLKGLGYPRAAITGRELSEDGERLVVHVEPGERQLLARIEIHGLPAEDVARLEASLPVRAGGPARRDLVTLASHAIEDDLRDRGYREAAVRTTLEPVGSTDEEGEGPLALLLRFEVEPGERHRVAGVRFEGLKGTRFRFAERVADLERGGDYRENAVGEARRRLSQTGLFESIRTSSESVPASGVSAGRGTTDRDATVQDTTVVFEVAEKPRYLLAMGARYVSGEDVGLVADAIDSNFVGRGTTLGLRAIYANAQDRSLRLFHAIPRVFGTKASLEVFVEGKDETTEGLLVDSVEGWVQVTSPLGPRIKNRLYLRYQDLVFRPEVSIGGLEPESEPGSRIVAPSLGWQLSFDNRSRDRNQAAISGRRPNGLFFGLDLVGTHEDLGSDFSVLGVFSQLKLFHDVAEVRKERESASAVTWAQSVRIGLQESFDDTEIPIIERLRAGGEYSVRGYRTNSLGPLDSEGNGLGGEAFFVLNEELHFPVWGEDVSGLVFLDAGNVWETIDLIDSELVWSVGFGVRASTPVGPIRLDLAVPLDKREIDDDFKVYIGFGNVF
ncbi:MAG: BamA/TamA family outer membrane protein, partial [bacterium]|nr:BamA/TamA family outer membrane protein [bacterium]